MSAPMFRKILVPVDFSDHSDKAMAMALDLARRYEAELILLHAVHLPIPVGHFPGGDVTVEYGQLVEYAESAARSQLQARVDQVALGDRARTSLRTGDPVQVILDEAERRGADLIVMGTHGRSGLSRLFMGSVAERVVRASPCPVLTARIDLPE